MNITQDDLRNIFYSGYPAATSWDILDELFIALDRDAITYRTEQLVPKDEFYTVSNLVAVIDGLGPQEKGHMALKEIAKRWLWKRYQVKAICETYFNGLHPDVCSADNRFVIECGTTDPSCIQIFLNDASVIWAANIPYPFSDDSYLMLHIFGRGPNYADWQQEKVDVTRSAFQKFHRK